MKISRKMDLDRLTRSVAFTASTRAGWREARKQLAANHSGRDAAALTIGQLWPIQKAVWAVDAAQSKTSR